MLGKEDTKGLNAIGIKMHTTKAQRSNLVNKNKAALAKIDAINQEQAQSEKAEQEERDNPAEPEEPEESEPSEAEEKNKKCQEIRDKDWSQTWCETHNEGGQEEENPDPPPKAGNTKGLRRSRSA